MKERRKKKKRREKKKRKKKRKEKKRWDKEISSQRTHYSPITAGGSAVAGGFQPMPGNQMPPYALTPFIVSNTPRGILLFFKILFIWERVSESTNRWEGQREREKQTLAEQEAPSGTRSQDPVVLTWAEGRWFTDWATQVPPLFFSRFYSFV